jgi:hypothetical protein
MRILLAIIVLFVIWLIADMLMATTEHHNVTVVDKHFSAEHNSTGTGVGYVGGKTAVIIISDHEDEKFLLMVRLESGEVVTAETTPTTFYSKSIGDSAICEIEVGKFSKSSWSTTVIK